MKPTRSFSAIGTSAERSHPLAIAGASFVIGAALAGSWFHFHRSNPAAGGNAVEISDASKNILSHLEQPVNLRFYSLLPAGSTGEELQAFSGRVNGLLTAMQNMSDGKIQFTRVDQFAGTNAAAAAADGIQAFDLDQGDASFLGLAVASGSHKETLARLEPAWEPALQSDIDRVIQRVAAIPAAAKLVPEISQPSPKIVNSIKQLIPDVNATSVEDADDIFHAEFVNQCTKAGTEMEAQINAAQQQVVQAQSHGSSADLETAQKNLLKVQLEQGEKIKQLAADLQTRLAVFQQMKTAAANPIRVHGV